jgi:hypothetical protein
MAGVSLRKVQELMGHETIAMTCRYARLSPQHQLDAQLLLDGRGKKSRKGAGIRTGTAALKDIGNRSIDRPQMAV